MSKIIRICPHCGCELIRARSHRHHRLFFAVIDAAYENWPEQCEFQPTSAEHLRSWLLVKAGYAERLGNLLSIIRPTPEKLTDFLQMCVHAIKTHGHGFLAVESEYAEFHVPKSIAWAELDQKEFAPIADEVFAQIEGVMGVRVNQLRRQAEQQIAPRRR